MTISRAAEGTEEDDEEQTDRDTVELSTEDLSRLRSLDDDGSDRDTIELTSTEAFRLAQAPAETEDASEETPPAPAPDVPMTPSRKTLDQVELDSADRAAFHTIPSPPSFDEEE